VPASFDSCKKIALSSHLLYVGLHIQVMGVVMTDTEREAEFERAVLPEANRLLGLAVAIVGDPHEAEDVVQESMFSAWRSWRALRDPNSLSAWLTRICVNHAIHRRRLLHRRLLWPPERWAVEPVLPTLPEARLAEIERAFRSLSGPQRAVVVLHHVDGLTITECAGALGCRPGTARSHLGRAMEKLRRGLADA